MNRYLGAAQYQQARTHTVRTAGSTPGRPGLVTVGVDDSPDSYVALDHAAVEADVHGWDLRLVHVQRAISGADRDSGAELLRRLTDRVHAQSQRVTVHSRLAIGPPASTLLGAVQDADLVVVGRRHGAAGAMLGMTVGDSVAAHHRGPVLIVRVPGWPPGPDFARRPLAAVTDGSPLGERAAAFAMAEARVRGCGLVLLHSSPAAVAGDYVETVDGVEVHHRCTRRDPAGALISASQEAAAVVAGRQNHGGVAETLLGSVSRAVVEHAPCPVFLIG
ncbi:universal stress protein [Actinoplanes sp. RD1]|uniref:universal stress protein n=1 Tax=Actinoplanes sp. RD1 TaxID=3064538 RepID=UPI002741B772|nr:universal stress protein [Actinoplanes sp. RD1]